MAPNLEGLGLLRQAARHVLWPMMQAPEFARPVMKWNLALVVVTSLSATARALAMRPMQEIMDVVTERDAARAWPMIFWSPLWMVIVINMQIAPAVVAGYFHVVLLVEWRRWFATKYLNEATAPYYHLNVQGSVTNPPARIAGLVDTEYATMWVEGAVRFAVTFAGTMAATSGLGLLREVPLAGFFLYLLVGSVLYFKTFRPVILHYDAWLSHCTRLQAKLLHVRENAEAVAMLRGSEYERLGAFRALELSNGPGQRYLLLQTLVYFGAEVYFEPLAGHVIRTLLGPRVLSGTLSLGSFYIAWGLLSEAIGHVASLCALIAGSVTGQMGMRRLLELALEIRNADEGRGRARGPAISLEEAGGQACGLVLRGLTLRTPAARGGLPPRMLLQGLSVHIPPAGSLLIAGESGIGKSSLVRAIAGLWRDGEGAILRPARDNIFFIAQRPYMCPGTLREQLLYPSYERADVTDGELRRVLRSVELEHLLQHPGLSPAGGGADKHWWAKLSLGEMQRLSFARLQLRGHQIEVALLDEATSALSPSVEEAMYTLLRGVAPSYVSVAHRPQLRRFHQDTLVLSHGRSGDEPAVCRLLPTAEYEQELEGSSGRRG